MPSRPALPRPSIPACLYLGSILAMLGALLVTYLDAQTNAERMLALRTNPPAEVAIERFRPNQNGGLAGELSVLAQADVSAPMRVGYSVGLRQLQAIVLPLLPLTDPAAEPALGAADLGYLVFPVEEGSDLADGTGALDARALLDDIRGEGSHGPIVAINGTAGVETGLRRQVLEGYEQIGRTHVDKPLMLEPFAGGRVVALSEPAESQWQSLLLWIAAACLTAGVIHASTEAETRDQEWAEGPGPRAARPRKPSTLRAESRFVPLAEQKELVAAARPQGESGGMRLAGMTRLRPRVARAGQDRS